MTIVIALTWQLFYLMITTVLYGAVSVVYLTNCSVDVKVCNFNRACFISCKRPDLIIFILFHNQWET